MKQAFINTTLSIWYYLAIAFLVYSTYEYLIVHNDAYSSMLGHSIIALIVQQMAVKFITLSLI